MRKFACFIILCAPALPAQTSAPAPRVITAAPATVISPEVLPDHRVVFRLRAPNASEVIITGDFWIEEGRRERLVEDAGGVWSLVGLVSFSYMHSLRDDADLVSELGDEPLALRHASSVIATCGPDR